MKVDKELQEKLHDLQLSEQNFQNFLLQKQAFQLELNETSSALEETEKADGEMYKIVGQVMLKADKNQIVKELQEKKQVLSLRVKSFEKQEQALREKIEKTRKILEQKLGNNK